MKRLRWILQTTIFFALIGSTIGTMIVGPTLRYWVMGFGQKGLVHDLAFLLVGWATLGIALGTISGLIFAILRMVFGNNVSCSLSRCLCMSFLTAFSVFILTRILLGQRVITDILLDTHAQYEASILISVTTITSVLYLLYERRIRGIPAA